MLCFFYHASLGEHWRAAEISQLRAVGFVAKKQSQVIPASLRPCIEESQASKFAHLSHPRGLLLDVVRVICAG
jgi:hypothetical protein